MKSRLFEHLVLFLFLTYSKRWSENHVSLLCLWSCQVLQQVWPFVGQYLEKLLVETIAPSIRASSSHLQTLGFTKVDMGDKVWLLTVIRGLGHSD